MFVSFPEINSVPQIATSVFPQCFYEKPSCSFSFPPSSYILTVIFKISSNNLDYFVCAFY